MGAPHAKAHTAASRKRFVDYRIRTKLTVFYFIILFVALGSTGLLYQNIYSASLTRSVSSVALQMLSSLRSNIVSTVEEARSLSNILVSSNELQTALETASSGSSSGSGGNVVVQIEQQRKVNAYISHFMEAFPYISSIYVFDSRSQRYGIDRLTVKSLKYDRIEDVEWYADAAARAGGYILRLDMGGAMEGIADQTCISLIRIVNDLNTQKPIGVLIVNISEEVLNESFKSIIEPYGTDIRIIGPEGKPIRDFAPSSGLGALELRSKAAGGSGTYLETIAGKKNLIAYLDIPEYGWSIISAMPFRDFAQVSSLLNATTLFVLVWIILLVVFSSLFISRFITVPVNKLVDSMKGVEKGEFQSVDVRTGHDEIGHLKDMYNMMISEIQTLFDKIREEQKTIRKTELDILQAQIKPHFLYNTFDSISSLALSGRNDDVYALIKALGSFYRTSLSRGSETITIRQELNVVKSYLTIQKVRFGDAFEIEYDIDDRVGRFRILRLTLQPLVENALVHGVLLKGTKGRIGVSTLLEDGRVLLSVEDDGVGMDQNQIDEALTTDSRGEKPGYGLKATVERIRIYYGPQGDVSIRSRKGEGTRIEIRIPALEDEADGE